MRNIVVRMEDDTYNRLEELIERTEDGPNARSRVIALCINRYYEYLESVKGTYKPPQ